MPQEDQQQPHAAPRISPKSRYTYRHLNQLAKSSVESPLRVVAHVDLDAFYAQCEMKRVGSGPEEPLAVQQWQNLIAVNYPARAHGVSRHITASEARKLCPEVKLVHVAVWQAGESRWSYIENPSVAICKASLDPYRAESKKIFSIFREECPDGLLEKAGIDESFLDLSKPIHDRLIQQYEVLRLPPYNDATENMPLPDLRTLDWKGSHLVANKEGDGERGEETEEEGDIDWDDIAMAIGADIIRDVRNAVFAKLGYTCSAGISKNKMLAKLGSAFRKPNQQSVVRQSAIEPFLSTFQFTKIRNLGGKLGEKISEHFQTESLIELLSKSLPQFQNILPDDTATWVYNVIRGVDKTPVTTRTAIKSMMSAKSFRTPQPSSFSDAQKWLKVFIHDISARIEDEDVVRKPKNMSISFTNAAGSRSRQIAIPGTGTVILMRTAELLLRTVAGEGPNVWPCTRLMLDISGFEEKESGNREIGAFFQVRQRSLSPPKEVKRPKLEDKPPATRQDPGITRFFVPKDRQQGGDGTVVCSDCGASISIDEVEEHKDWHFAKALSEQRDDDYAQPPPPPPPKPSKKGKPKPKAAALEKGQRQLRF